MRVVFWMGVTNVKQTQKIGYEELEFIPLSQIFINRFGLEFLGLNLFNCSRSLLESN